MSETYVIVPFKSQRLNGISFAIDAQDYDLYVGKMPSIVLHGCGRTSRYSWTKMDL